MMHRIAWDFLQAVRDACEPLVDEMFGPDFYGPNESNVSYIVMSLLTASHLGDSRLMEKATEVVRDRLKGEEGSRVMMRLVKLDSPIQHLGILQNSAEVPEVASMLVSR